METMVQKYLELRNRFENEAGQTLVEYGLLIALLAIVVIGALLVLGPTISGLFGDINAQL